MSYIDRKVAYLKETKERIKNAIKRKGIEVSDEDTFRSYANKLLSIPSGPPEQLNVKYYRQPAAAQTPKPLQHSYDLEGFEGKRLIISAVNSGGTKHYKDYLEPMIFTNCSYIKLGNYNNASSSTANGWGSMYMLYNIKGTVNVTTSAGDDVNFFISYFELNSDEEGE